MDENEARMILEHECPGIIDEKDNSLYSLGLYLSWNPRDKEAVLDGRFSSTFLKALVWWMENKEK